jgi:hypothetical protein
VKGWFLIDLIALYPLYLHDNDIYKDIKIKHIAGELENEPSADRLLSINKLLRILKFTKL